jgi:hypothetical protein
METKSSDWPNLKKYQKKTTSHYKTQSLFYRVVFMGDITEFWGVLTPSF